MAEARNVWEDLLARHHHAITTAFRELTIRWRGILDQEQARWSQAGHEWQFTTGPDGEWHWDPYPKPLEAAVEGYQQALHDMREATAMRLPWEAYSGYGSSMSGPPPERRGEVRTEGFVQQLAESSRDFLEQKLERTETFQRQYTPANWQWWDLGEEARQIREALAERFPAPGTEA